MARLAASALVVLVIAMAICADDQQSQPIPPAEAQNHIGETVSVEMAVKVTRKSTRRKTVFLDSLEDFQDADNLGIAIDEAAEQELGRKFSNSDLPALFLNKSILVTGKIARRDDRTYLDVSQASQIELSPAN